MLLIKYMYKPKSISTKNSKESCVKKSYSSDIAKNKNFEFSLWK